MAIVRINRFLEAELTGRAGQHGPMEHALGEVASSIARRAQGIARGEYYRSGGYARGIHGIHGLDEQGELVGRVVATDWKSHWAERPPRQERAGRRGRILARAAEAEGYRVVAAGAAGALLGGGGGGRLALPAAARRAIR